MIIIMMMMMMMRMIGKRKNQKDAREETEWL